MSGRKHYLSFLEEVVLRTIQCLEPEAYVSAIQRKVSEVIGQDITHGAMYGVLEGLERIKFVKSSKGEPRRGQVRRYYTVKVLAKETLKAMDGVRKKIEGGLNVEASRVPVE